MRMDANIRFEIRADAFHRMTGMLAPGKNAWQGPSREERTEAWEKWNKDFSTVIDAMFQAIEYIGTDGKEIS